ILALNNAAGPTILPLDAARIRKLYDSAEYFRVAERDGTLAGFLVGMGSDADHDSSNLHWFRAHCERFFHIDRIVVSSRRCGGGFGGDLCVVSERHAHRRYPLLNVELVLEHDAVPLSLLRGRFDSQGVSGHVMPERGSGLSMIP